MTKSERDIQSARSELKRKRFVWHKMHAISVEQTETKKQTKRGRKNKRIKWKRKNSERRKKGPLVLETIASKNRWNGMRTDGSKIEEARKNNELRKVQ